MGLWVGSDVCELVCGLCGWALTRVGQLWRVWVTSVAFGSAVARVVEL